MGIESKKECVYVYIYTYIHTKTLIKLTKKKINERESSFELLFLFKIIYVHLRVFLVAQMVKNLLGIMETGVRFPGQEDPLEKAMATHSSILPWKIPQTEEPGGQRVGHD